MNTSNQSQINSPNPVVCGACCSAAGFFVAVVAGTEDKLELVPNISNEVGGGREN